MTVGVSLKSLLGLVALVLVFSGGSRWWASHSAEQVGEQMAALAGPGEIEMLSSQSCAPCAAARDWLTTHRVRFSECLIETDAACNARHQAMGQVLMSPGTPIVLVRGQPQLGFSPQRVLARLSAPT